jgi:hypothetical protein
MRNLTRQQRGAKVEDLKEKTKRGFAGALDTYIRRKGRITIPLQAIHDIYLNPEPSQLRSTKTLTH